MEESASYPEFVLTRFYRTYKAEWESEYSTARGVVQGSGAPLPIFEEIRV